jgi:uncharacterized protein YigA (DUF484 family)
MTVELWISKTHVRIYPAEMTRADAVALAKDIIAELEPAALTRSRNHHTIWTSDLDEQLRVMREKKFTLREIAAQLLGDADKDQRISARINRLQLPVDPAARARGVASQVARWAKVAK